MPSIEMEKRFCFVVLILFAVPALTENVLNTCMDGAHHKTTPGPESSLFGVCAPWKGRSCCTNETAYSSHQDGPDGLYNFNYNHCSLMSSKCRQRFQENDCFYECSPNVGPWIINESNAYRNQRFRDVPLSVKVCEDWWNDCQDDYTCKDNWSVGWNWTSGVNECPTTQTCKKFADVFPNATFMCENAFPGDFKVVANEPSMVLWFEGETNPNDEVAKYYAKEMGLCCGAQGLKVHLDFSLFLSCVVMMIMRH